MTIGRRDDIHQNRYFQKHDEGELFMIRTAVSGIVDAPIEKVWNFMVDLGTMSQRDPSVTGVRWDPPLKVGSVAEIDFRQLGKRTGRYEVKELELHQRLMVQMKAMGRIEAMGTWLLDPVAEDKTRLSASIQIDIHGLMKLISPFLSISASRGARKGFNRIKDAIEAQGTSCTGLASPQG